MNKLFFILGLVLLTSCKSSVVVEKYETKSEAQKSIYDVEYNTGERTPIQVMNISVTKEIVNQYPGLADKRVGLGLTNRILENFEETGFFRYTEEKEEIINKKNVWEYGSKMVWNDKDNYYEGDYHPNLEGYKIISQYIYNEITQLL